MIAAVIYGLCAVLALVCAWLLFTAYRRSRYRLLLWSSLFFMLTTVNNIFLVVDKLIFPTEIDLSLLRYGLALITIAVLLYGLVWNSE
ncbi:MAG TPA: DUF5985 family protein [Nitrospiraceae bacterium]|nr:DUF5985 family protein [Nitrospiraceae bacterium]